VITPSIKMPRTFSHTTLPGQRWVAAWFSDNQVLKYWISRSCK
jgi:hypothetical protein